jgi:hypothetical protein
MARRRQLRRGPRYRWKETITASRIDGLHEVRWWVVNSRSGQTIYELQTLLSADGGYQSEGKGQESKREGDRG